MKTLIGALVLAGALVAASAALAAPKASSDLCDQLIADAARVKASDWAQGDKALRPMLQIQNGSSNPPSFEAGLADLPAVKAALHNETDTAFEFVDRLAGTDIYSVSTYQGTLNCQASVFVEAKPGQAPRLIDGPGLSDELCGTQSGDFGLVYGQAAFIEHGAVSQESDDEDIRITPWTGVGWGPACRIGLRFRDAFTVTNSLCGDHAVCQAAGRIATAVAARYNAWSGKRQTGGFWYGANPSASAVAGLVALGKTLDHAGTTEFPLFGSAGRWRFSYSGFALFPLALDGRTYVGAIGHDGVGWRENTVTLLALYIRDGAGLKPVAGFTIDRKIGGLAAAVREAPDALPKRARPD